LATAFATRSILAPRRSDFAQPSGSSPLTKFA
jgi:hypothetical protein